MDIPVAQKPLSKIHEREAVDANPEDEMHNLKCHSISCSGIGSENNISNFTEQQSRLAILRREHSGGSRHFEAKVMLPNIGSASSKERVSTGRNGPPNPQRQGIVSCPNKQYLNILQSMGQAVHVVDLSGVTVYWSRAAEQLYGYSASEAVGQHIKGFVVEEHDIIEASEIMRTITSGKNWTGQFRVRTKQGESLQVVATNTPFYDDTDTLVGILCLSSDLRPFQENIVPIPSKDDLHPSSIRLSKSGLTTSKPGFDSQHKPPKVLSSITSKLASKLRGKLWLKMRTSHESTKKYDNQGGHNSCFGYQKTILSDHRVHASADDKDTHKAGSYNMIAYKLKGISWVWERQHNQVPDTKQFGGSKASSSLSYNLHYNRPSSLGSGSGTRITSSSSSCSPCLKSSTGDSLSLNYDISWEDLTFREQIGRGSCATVYHGLWCGSDVAVKIYFNFEYSDDLLCSFRREVSLMKRLRHPNVLLFMGAVTSPRHLCIVTELLSRGSLFKLLQLETSTLGWKRRLLMALDIARGMNYLHSHDPPIVHRDLKSSNLLVDKDWTVKVGDFGLSRLKHGTLLSTNSGRGTPQWMAPEVILNEPANEKADVYSFGVILWELATSKIPWADLKPMQGLRCR